MFSDKTVRLVGIFLNVIVVIFYLIAMCTSHWVRFNNGVGCAGLWQYCNLPTPNSSVNITPIPTTPLPRQRTSAPKRRLVDEDDEDDTVGEDECHEYGLTNADDYLHIVRALVVFGFIFFICALFNGGNLKPEVQRHQSIIRRHRGEIVNASGAILAKVGLCVYKSDNVNDSHIGKYLESSSLAWSYDMLDTAVYLTIPTVILMIAPTLYNSLCSRYFGSRSDTVYSDARRGSQDALCTSFRDDPFGNVYRCMRCKKRPQHDLETSHDNSPDETAADLSTLQIDTPSSQGAVAGTRRRSDISWPHPEIEPHNHSDIFTIGPDSTGRHYCPAYSEPAPPYEELPPCPKPIAPPSYEDVITGRAGPPSLEILTSSPPLPPPVIPVVEYSSTVSITHSPPPYEESSFTRDSLARSSSVSL